jgi:hypothetical protein
LAVALLSGLIATAGLALTHRHGAANVAKANGVATQALTVLQQAHALVASLAARYMPASSGHAHRVVYTFDSNSQASGVIDRSGSQLHDSRGSSSQVSYTADNVAGGSQPQGNHPTTADTNHAPPTGAGQFAYNGYAPLYCGLPAGCGGGTNVAYVTRDPSGTSGTVPSTHVWQGSSTQNDDSSSPPNTQQQSDPPGQTPPGGGSIASAPELDPATLAGAVTLLLGALAILRGRRVRVTLTR